MLSPGVSEVDSASAGGASLFAAASRLGEGTTGALPSRSACRFPSTRGNRLWYSLASCTPQQRAYVLEPGWMSLFLALASLGHGAVTSLFLVAEPFRSSGELFQLVLRYAPLLPEALLRLGKFPPAL